MSFPYESPSTMPPVGCMPSRILMVEDSASDVFLFRMMLDEDMSGRQYIIHDVPKLTEAFKLIVRDEFDLIVLDMNLPDMHGVTSVEVLHAEVPEVPIIVYSGMDSPSLRDKALAAGATRYIVKGVESVRGLKAIIDEALIQPLA